MGTSTDRLITVLELQNKQFDAAVQSSEKRYQKFMKAILESNNVQRKQQQLINETRDGQKKLQASLLATGFFLKMVSNATGSLLKPALEASGAFDVWNALLTTFFLPVAIKVTEALTSIFDVLSNLPDWAKEIGGWTVALVAVTAAVASFLAFLSLGAAAFVGLLTRFGLIAPAAEGAAAALEGAGAAAVIAGEDAVAAETSVASFSEVLLALPAVVTVAVVMTGIVLALEGLQELDDKILKITEDVKHNSLLSANDAFLSGFQGTSQPDSYNAVGTPIYSVTHPVSIPSSSLTSNSDTQSQINRMIGVPVSGSSSATPPSSTPGNQTIIQINGRDYTGSYGASQLRNALPGAEISVVQRKVSPTSTGSKT